MIVRARDDGEIESVGKLDDIGSLLLDRPHTLWRTVAQLDRVQSRESMLLVFR
jgi:hypothetical protein